MQAVRLQAAHAGLEHRSKESSENTGEAALSWALLIAAHAPYVLSTTIKVVASNHLIVLRRIQTFRAVLPVAVALFMHGKAVLSTPSSKRMVFVHLNLIQTVIFEHDVEIDESGLASFVLPLAKRVVQKE